MRKFSIAILVLISAVCSVGSAQDYCAGLPRKVHLPAALVRISAGFEDPDTGANATGQFHGWILRPTLMLTNVGTLPQVVRAEVTEISAIATITRKGGPTTPYSPSPWNADSGNQHKASMKATYGPTKVPALRNEVTIQPGDTVRFTLGMECQYNANMSNCESYDANNANLRAFNPNVIEPPRVNHTSFTVAVRVCVKGPAGKETLGAINGSFSVDGYVIANPDPGMQNDDDRENVGVAYPILSGFAF